MKMRLGDPLIGRLELYLAVGVAIILGVAYVVRTLT